MKLPNDPFILELLPEFIDDWLSQIDANYSPLVETKNEGELYRLGHTLKGSCYQFGLDNIAEMGIELMGYCREQNFDKVATLKDPIRKGFVDMKEFLQNQ